MPSYSFTKDSFCDIYSLVKEISGFINLDLINFSEIEKENNNAVDSINGGIILSNLIVNCLA